MLNPAFTSLVTNPLYPQSVTTLANGFGQAVNTKAQQFNSDQGDIKVDYNATNNDHIFARYSKGNQYDPSSNSVALLGNTVNEAFLQNGAVNWTHSFSPNMTNEARFGKNYVKLPTGLTTFDSSVGALGNTIGIESGNPAGVDGLPELGFGGGTITNIANGALTNLGSAVVVQKFSSTVTQFDDVLIYTHGRHVIKTGFQTNRYNINVFYSGNSGELGVMLFGNGPGGSYSGNGDGGGDPAADWALGLPQDVGRGTSTGGWHQRDWLFAGFAQDDWRITDTLTLNLGLRYEARTPWIEINNRQVGVNILTGTLEFPGNTPVPAGAVGTNGFSDGLYKSTYGLPNFQPRLGFAWSPQEHGRQDGHSWRLHHLLLPGRHGNQPAPYAESTLHASAGGSQQHSDGQWIHHRDRIQLRQRRRREIHSSERHCWPGAARFSRPSPTSGMSPSNTSLPTTRPSKLVMLASARLT